MKTIIYFKVIVLLLFIGTTKIWGQSKIVQKETDKRDYVSFVKFATDTVIPLKNASDLLKTLHPKAKEADVWNLSAKRKEIKDDKGYTHQFYQQYYKGVKVEGGEFSIHAVNDNIESVLGNFEPVGDVSVTTKLSEKEALSSALKHIGADVYKWQIPEEEAWIKEYYNDSYYPKGELVIVKSQLKTNSEYRLAYKFDIYAHKPMSNNYVWVDAINGEVIGIESRIHFSNATGTAATRYSGTRTITADSYNGTYRLRETRNGVNISTFNMNHTGSYTSTDFTDNDNNWTAAEFHNTNKDDAALDAHWGAEMVYNYFKNVHNRNSWNGNNGALLSYVNGNLPLIDGSFSNSDNAFWNGNRMTYGQGTYLSPFVTLDIVAHEIGHGICESTANLGVAAAERGAINESLSDIWAACVENWATTDKQTWSLCEDLGVSIRSMSNPNLFNDPDTYQGTNWYTGSNASIYVHRNSGVGNFWFYLLSQGGIGTNDLGNTYNVTGIGINKAAAIVYKAEISYLTSSANYAQFRNATISAATNLYGANSPEVMIVNNAWYAVGVGSQYIVPTISGLDFVPCTGTVTYTSNVNGTWTVSSNLQIVSGQGTNSITVQKVSSNTTVVRYATVSINDITKNILIGSPKVTSIDGPGVAGGGLYYFSPNPYYPAATYSTNWYIYATDGSGTANFTITQNINNYLGVRFTKPGTYMILCAYSNACATSSEMPVYITLTVTQNDLMPTYSTGSGNDSIGIDGSSSSVWSSAYPNPANNELIIARTEDDSSIAISALNTQSVKGKTSEVRVLLYSHSTARLVYNKIHQSSEKQIRIDVSKLPDGIYHLNMIENGEKVKEQTVIVNH
ncbi:MAG: M4 family metallopeptidase [Prevotellaceae bacterium]|jgi:Zn-dependent metalloprotease|nr:M4 family metallopeptidase [Prevotellaceae bacterium]